MPAKIFSPAKNAMQSGKGKADVWILEYDRETPRVIEPLMGYTSSSDMNSQIKLKFENQEQAEAYAKKHGIAYQVQVPRQSRRRKASYAENFSYDRILPWTH